MSDKTCLDFMKNPNINPVTGRKIKLNGPVYKKLEKRCYSKIFNKKQKRNTKIFQDFLYPINPETGRKIKLNGKVYNKIKHKYNSFEIKSPKYTLSSDPNIQETIIVSNIIYNIPKKIKQWNIGKKVGSGGFGSVYDCTHDYKNNIKYVVKFMPKNSFGVENEIKVYTESYGKGYSFLPKCFAIGIYGDLCFIVIEKLKPFNFTFSKISYLYEIYKKFYLKLNRVHGDVKFSNIMIRQTSNKKEDIVLIDFGMSVKFEKISSKKTETIFGTPMYISRNSMNRIITNQNDLESLCYCILNSKYVLPWNSKDNNSIENLLILKENFVDSFLSQKIELKEINDSLFEFMTHVFIVSKYFISNISYKYLDMLMQ